MRQLNEVIDRVRVRRGPMASTTDQGMNGAFGFSKDNVHFIVIASDGSGWKESKLPGEPWEHVSVRAADYDAGGRPVERLPTWSEMCLIKDMFFKSTEWVVQFHPSQSEYVNHHPFVLHLWRPVNGFSQTPPSICVGPKC